MGSTASRVLMSAVAPASSGITCTSGCSNTESGGSEWKVTGAGVAAAAAVRAATIPGARFARGTLRGRPALVVWTEAAWSVAGAAASGPPASAGAAEPSDAVVPQPGAG